MTIRTIPFLALLLPGLALVPAAAMGARPVVKPAAEKPALAAPAQPQPCKPNAGKPASGKGKSAKTSKAPPCVGTVKAVTGPARVKGSGFFGGAAVPLLGLGGAGGGIAATVASSTSDSPASP